MVLYLQPFYQSLALFLITGFLVSTWCLSLWPTPDHQHAIWLLASTWWLYDLALYHFLPFTTTCPSPPLALHRVNGPLPATSTRSLVLYLITGPLPSLDLYLYMALHLINGLYQIIDPLLDHWAFAWSLGLNLNTSPLPNHWLLDHWASTWTMALYLITNTLPDHWSSTWTLGLHLNTSPLPDHRASTWTLALYLITEPLLSLDLYMISNPTPEHWTSTVSGSLHDQ